MMMEEKKRGFFQWEDMHVVGSTWDWDFWQVNVFKAQTQKPLIQEYILSVPEGNKADGELIKTWTINVSR